MPKFIRTVEDATIRFAGDSGDGMQLVGTQFSETAASTGIDVNTFPDYPSEIRAPEGTLYGVSAFQVHVGSKKVNTHGDVVDVLVAMNASSLKVNIPRLADKCIIIADMSGFDTRNLKLAGYEDNPLKSQDLSNFKVVAVDIEQEVKKLLKGSNIAPKVIKKTRNFFALGLTLWLFDRSQEHALRWLSRRFANEADILEANTRALQAGYDYAQNSSLLDFQYKIEHIGLEKGTYRNISGNEAVALALVAASQKSRLPLFLGSYPITPATDILQYISALKRYGIKHLQAEDEIAGICSAIGAAYGGNLAFTTTSGPGLSLKIEAIGLAVMTELPLVIINVQRAGPSTGLPTKPEQSDLLQAMYGRHGEAPLPVIAARSAADCFDSAYEGARLALKYMTPVIVLTDGYIAQGSEPWKVPLIAELPDITVKFHDDPATFQPYKRDPETLARMWAIPGMQGMEHRIGGLEKQDIKGNVSHDPLNHQKMTELRKAKIDGIASDIPDAKILGPDQGKLLVLGWGSTYGAIRNAADIMQNEGHQISHVHLRHLHPFPENLGTLMDRFEEVLVPEMNLGQLQIILQSRYLRKVEGLHKVQGNPFTASEIVEKISSMLH
ncbi:MAG: 2-oxoacid:acceptor oxidoreductase subunit alpha [Cyclobacteriaceae bacterium]|nr:2-oxoacid:acceptor oxidoreductase subunit alpha [Cyclobacteriaceae bacterium]